MDKTQVNEFYDDMKLLINDLSENSSNYKGFGKLHFLYKSKYSWERLIQSNLINCTLQNVFYDTEFIF